MKNFVGSKNGAGIKQWLISLMPAHRVYVESFLGKGAVLLAKRPASVSIGIDYDAGVIDGYWCRHAQPGLSIVHGDALSLLPLLKVQNDWLIYADPPYLMSVRSSKRSYYAKELFTEAAHDRLLSILTSLQCNVMISGYQSELYSMRLKDWTVKTKWTTNRRGKRVQEFCWMNFEPPAVFHDTRFVGNDFTDRQRIKRKAGRWLRKFSTMPAAERQVILTSLLAVKDHNRDPIAKTDFSGQHSQNQPWDPASTQSQLRL
jgi:hypothetical protein